MAYGIALAGGGTRGAAHVGVLMALEEAGLYPRSVAGTSAGSIVAGLYAAGMPVEEMARLVQKLTKRGIFLIDPDYLGILASIAELFVTRNISLSGFIKGNRLERFLDRIIESGNIEDLPMKTVIPAVDLLSGNTVVYTNAGEPLREIERVQWKYSGPLCGIIRASSAVPAVFQPKQMDGMCLVDGGVTDVLPVDLLIAAGEESVLAVDLSEEYEMPDSHNIIEIASHSLTIMESRLRGYISSGEKLMLHPQLPKNAGLLAFGSMEACMEAGYQAAKAMVPAMKTLFGEECENWHSAKGAGQGLAAKGQ